MKPFVNCEYTQSVICRRTAYRKLSVNIAARIHTHVITGVTLRYSTDCRTTQSRHNNGRLSRQEKREFSANKMRTFCLWSGHECNTRLTLGFASLPVSPHSPLAREGRGSDFHFGRLMTLLGWMTTRTRNRQVGMLAHVFGYLGSLGEVGVIWAVHESKSEMDLNYFINTVYFLSGCFCLSLRQPFREKSKEAMTF